MSRALDRGQQPIAPGALGTGTPGSGNFLRGDGTWAAATPTIASTAEAEAGTNNTNFITPLRMREGFNASGSAPVYACRAWVNFDGITGPGTIRASGNVSSVTFNGTGDYTVNFTTAMPDANYAVSGAHNANYGSSQAAAFNLFTDGSFAEAAPSTSSFRFVFGGLNSAVYNPKYCAVSVFR